MTWSDPTSVAASSAPLKHGLRPAIELPKSLAGQLKLFRQRVWLTQIAQAILIFVLAGSLALLVVFLSDRLTDTHWQVRMALLVAACHAGLVLPWAVYRWVWQQRRPDQLARLLRCREPTIGDQLLSAIELVEDKSEQIRSSVLCAAAIGQVAEVVAKRDLRLATPQTRLRWLAICLAASWIALLICWSWSATAFQNATARLVWPWRDTPRFTFAQVEQLAENHVVPHGETAPLRIQLAPQSQLLPARARLLMHNQDPLEATLDGRHYHFDIPPQSEARKVRLSVGDYYQDLIIDPQLRPQVVSSTATIRLPDYLRHNQVLHADARSGILTALQGSTLVINTEISRSLHEAQVNGLPIPHEERRFKTQEILVGKETSQLEMNWTDYHGLKSLDPFCVSIQPVTDEAPSVAVQELPRQLVVLDSEQLNFQIMAADDYGIKQVGLSWQGVDPDATVTVAQGQKALFSGAPELNSASVSATFCAATFGIQAQTIELRCWVEDYLPGRQRVIGSTHLLYVLDEQQHAAWVMEQMSKWQRSAIDVRDKELQLHQENRRLQNLVAELTDDQRQSALRDQLNRQAALEQANSRRLADVTRIGQQLLRSAARNSEIGVGHLDRWAEMLQILNDISGQRMPIVAEKLSQASEQALPFNGQKASSSRPSAAAARSSTMPPRTDDLGPQESANSTPEAPQVPSLTDAESSLAGPVESSENAAAPVKESKGGGRFTLPQTTIAGSGKAAAAPDKQPQEDSHEQPLDQAIQEQADLLAQFEKVAVELNEVLANLEGSTLAKRLKAVSREQIQVAEKLTSHLPAFFGAAGKAAQADRHALDQLVSAEQGSRQKVAYIMDDMQAYFERRRMNQFKLVLDDMRSVDVLDSLTELGDTIPKKQGLAIAQAEYWADSLDRWAEDLADPACSGQCPGCKTSDSLPPSLVLEALKILESEVNLREDTRVAQQAKTSISEDQHQKQAKQLSTVQDNLRRRTDELSAAIADLPGGQQRFAKEIQLLSAVSFAMTQAVDSLSNGSTGPETIAAETEAIELLLRSKRINPKASGGGGGADPGGGGTGSTQDTALALLGTGWNPHEHRQARPVSQATGETGPSLPEEYRGGLDQYFERLEQLP